MRKLQKPPVKEVKTSKQEPLAEGLQVVPTDPAGRRLWSKMSNEEIVGFAKKLMEDKEMTKVGKLRSTDSGLYYVLLKRRLLARAFAHIDQRREDSARDAVIDALSAFGSDNQNLEEKIGVA